MWWDNGRPSSDFSARVTWPKNLLESFFFASVNLEKRNDSVLSCCLPLTLIITLCFFFSLSRKRGDLSQSRGRSRSFVGNDGLHRWWLALSSHTWSSRQFSGQINSAKVHPPSHRLPVDKLRLVIRLCESDIRTLLIPYQPEQEWTRAPRIHSLRHADQFSVAWYQQQPSPIIDPTRSILPRRSNRHEPWICVIFLWSDFHADLDMRRNLFLRYFLISLSDINTFASIVNWREPLHLHTSSDVNYHRPFEKY